MKTGRGKRKDFVPVLCASITFIFALSTFHLRAQVPTLRHSCWDIDITSDNSPLSDLHSPFIMMAARQDTGMLIVEMARQYIGTPYRFGGRSPKAFDCAGFALYLYKHFGHNLPGWSGAQARLGVEVSDTRNLLPGDLVFFGGRGNKKVIGHTGIVVDADEKTGTFRFIHASTGAGVIISRSTEDYYRTRYITARRILL